MASFQEEEDDDSNNYEPMDLKIINFIKMMNSKENEVIPIPTYFTISTQSAMCCIGNIEELDLSKIVVNIAKNIITNIILNNNKDYLIQGIVVDNIVLRFDESYLKKYKKPYIKYMGKLVDYTNKEECFLILNSIDELEKKSLKKQGKQDKKKDNEHFYNSCSIIVKAALDVKCVNIKLFNNGKITLTGSKKEEDGFNSCKVLLEELKKYPDIFINLNKDHVKLLEIINCKITMINSDFNTNFKIDLLKLLTILNTNKKELFTKFNPEKYRGLIIGYYWNTENKIQDGRCDCKGKCNGKGNGTGPSQCKKITISIFKSGSIIITGGRLVKQIEDAYSFINNILKENYKDIIKLSILDYIDENEENEDIVNTLNNEYNVDNSKIFQKETKPEKIKKIKDIKKNNEIKIEKPKKTKIITVKKVK
jgi:TATA-box binding protein (TBP) (component of TFIID and TFIIIB)